MSYVFEPVSESKVKGSKSNIVKSCGNLYAHLMKCCFVKPISLKWIDTIVEQLRQLIDIKNESYWRDVIYDQVKLNKIKRKAIETYTNDGNKNAEIAYTIVHSKLPDIQMFRRNPESVKAYLIELANEENNNELIDIINNKFNSKNL